MALQTFAYTCRFAVQHSVHEPRDRDFSVTRRPVRQRLLKLPLLEALYFFVEESVSQLCH